MQGELVDPEMRNNLLDSSGGDTWKGDGNTLSLLFDQQGGGDRQKVFDDGDRLIRQEGRAQTNYRRSETLPRTTSS